MPVVEAVRAEGITSATGIAKALNERGIPTIGGGRWQALQVQRILRSELDNIDAPRVPSRSIYALHREKRDIKRSDAIDLIHAMYLPHTDLWRGDKAFSKLLIKNRVNFHEHIVPTLLELPRRIETEIAMARNL